MSFTNSDDSWPIVIDQQGKHGTDVDLTGIRRFLDQIAVPIIIKALCDVALTERIRKATRICPERLRSLFFQSSNWILNMERRELPARAHYRAMTMRIYDQDFGLGSFRAVIQLEGNERRYGHLHLPPKLNNDEASALTVLVLSAFVPAWANDHLGQATYEVSANAARAMSEPSYRTKKVLDQKERIVRDSRTIFRSKDRKLGFLKQYHSQAGEDFPAVSEDKLNLILKSFWEKHRRSANLPYNKVVRDLLLSDALNVCGLIDELPSGEFALGEGGEILIEEYWDRASAVEEEEKKVARAASDKKITNLTEQRDKLWSALKKTSQNLREEKKKRIQLG